jgi:hypothetical protein
VAARFLGPLSGPRGHEVEESLSPWPLSQIDN